MAAFSAMPVTNPNIDEYNKSSTFTSNVDTTYNKSTTLPRPMNRKLFKVNTIGLGIGEKMSPVVVVEKEECGMSSHSSASSFLSSNEKISIKDM